MVKHYLSAEVQAHTHCLGSGLGGEEWVKHIVDDGRLDADAIVVDADVYPTLCGRR